VPSEFRDAMLGGKGRYRSGPPNLRAAGDGNHDGCLLLTFLRRLNGKTAAAPDGGEDAEEVDGEHRVEKHLKVTLRHAVSLQPAIHDDQVFDFDGEAWRFTGRGLAGSALLLPHLHVGQCFKLAGTNFDGGGGLLDRDLGLRVTTL